MTIKLISKNYYIFIILILILVYTKSSYATQGAFIGVSIWYNSLVPVLLPPLILLNLIQSLIHCKSNLPIIVLCALAGIPASVKTLSTLFINGKISNKAYKCLIIMLSNPSFSFLSTYIFILTSKKYTVSTLMILYPLVIVLLSSLLTTLIYWYINKPSDYYFSTTEISQTTDFTTAIEESISTSTTIILKILGYVVIFSTISELIKSLGNNMLTIIIQCYLEISCGILIILDNFNSPQVCYSLICSLCAFGGLCGIFQCMSVIPKELNISYSFFIKYKMLNALNAFSISYIVLKCLI